MSENARTDIAIKAMLSCGDFVSAAELIKDLSPESPARKRLWSELLFKQEKLEELEQYSRDHLDEVSDALLKVLNQARVAIRRGQNTLVIQVATAALHASHEGSDDLVRGSLHSYVARAWFRLREVEKAGEHTRQAIAHYTRADAPSHVAGMVVFLGRIEIAQGEWERGTALLRRGIDGFGPVCEPGVKYAAIQTYANILLFRGWFETAAPSLNRALAISQEIGRPQESGMCHAVLGLWAVRTGREAEARSHFVRALQTAKKATLPRLEAQACEYLGEFALARGQFEAARRWLERAISLGKRVNDVSIESEAKARLAETALAKADVASADLLINEAISEFQQMGDLYEVAVSKRARIQVRMALGDWDGAASDLDASRGFLERIDERFEIRRIERLETALREKRVIQDIRADEPLRIEIVGGRSERGFLSTGVEDVVKQEGRQSRPVAKRRTHPKTPTHHPDFPSILGQSPHLLVTLEEAKRYAALDCAVLIEGETGTGKELIARAIHRLSSRREGEFVPFNSGTSSPEIFDAEIFGHIRGAFTGAVSNRDGLARMAHRGTLFLDEIAELNVELQPRLLRLLDSGEVRPVGADKSGAVNLRVIAATHRDLLQLSHDGDFRQDLLYRLIATRVRIPPLRERKEDLEVLVPHFVKEAQAWKSGFLGVSDRVMQAMAEYEWPGNIRELRNEVTRLAAITDDGYAQHWSPTVPRRDERGKIDPFSRESIEAELRRAHGSVTIVAERLKVSRARIYRLVKELGVDVRRFRPR